MIIQKWVKASNYMGDDMSEYYEGLTKIPHDPNALVDSNFDTALELLGGESETVRIGNFGHWVVGSIDQIFVHESDLKAVAKLEDIAQQLAQYPVLDDEDYSERESEATDELWKNMDMGERIEALKRHNESIFAARTNTAYDLYHHAEQTYDYIQMMANE